MTLKLRFSSLKNNKKRIWGSAKQVFCLGFSRSWSLMNNLSVSPNGHKPGKRWNSVYDCGSNCFRKHKTLVCWWGSFMLLAIIVQHLYMKITIQSVVLRKSISLHLSLSLFHFFWDRKMLPFPFTLDSSKLCLKFNVYDSFRI